MEARFLGVRKRCCTFGEEEERVTGRWRNRLTVGAVYTTPQLCLLGGGQRRWSPGAGSPPRGQILVSEERKQDSRAGLGKHMRSLEQLTRN